MTSSTALCHELLELLLLLVVEDGFDLRSTVLHDGLSLGTAVSGREGRIGAQSLHLADTIDKDGLDLRHLVLAEIQFPAEAASLAGGMSLKMAALRGWSGLRATFLNRIVRGLLLRIRLREDEPGGEQCAEDYGCDSWITERHKSLFSLAPMNRFQALVRLDTGARWELRRQSGVFRRADCWKDAED